MRNLTIAALLPLVMLASLPARAQDERVIMSPEQIGQIFCISSLGNDMGPAFALLTPDLATVITSAQERNNAFELEHPGEKPPLGDGLPWRTWQDYADGCAVGTVDLSDGLARVAIDYSFSDSPEANYSNELVIRMQDDFWVIDDVDLGDGNTLRSTLAGAFES